MLNVVTIGAVLRLLVFPWLDGLGNAAVVWRATVLVVGIAVFAVGCATYVGAHLSPGPRDGLMVAVHLGERSPSALRAGSPTVLACRWVGPRWTDWIEGLAAVLVESQHRAEASAVSGASSMPDTLGSAARRIATGVARALTSRPSNVPERGGVVQQPLQQSRG